MRGFLDADGEGCGLGEVLEAELLEGVAGARRGCSWMREKRGAEGMGVLGVRDEVGGDRARFLRKGARGAQRRLARLALHAPASPQGPGGLCMTLSLQTLPARTPRDAMAGSAMEARQLVSLVLLGLLRFAFMVSNNVVAIPSYFCYVLVLQPLRLLDPLRFWYLEGLLFKWLLGLVASWGWSAGYSGKTPGPGIHPSSFPNRTQSPSKDLPFNGDATPEISCALGDWHSVR